MKFIDNLSQKWQQHRRDTGKISEAEFIVNTLPPDLKTKGFNMLSELMTLDIVAQPMIYNQKMQAFRSFIQDAYNRDSSKNYNPINPPMSRTSELFGYKPAGAKIWDYFANPFEVYAYCGIHYPAARQCLDLVRNAIDEDGFYLLAREGISVAKLQRMHELCRILKIDELRSEMAVHLQLYGNVWMRPNTSEARLPGLKGRLTELELLYPTRMLMDFNNKEEVEKWIYTEGQVRTTYAKNALMHLRIPAVDNNQLGSPKLTAAITQIETVFHAQAFNNTLFYRGGLLGHILTMRPPDNKTFSVQESRDWMRDIMEQLAYLSGAKAGGRIVALPWVDNALKITDFTTMDSIWRYGTERCDKIVSQLQGIPSEKVGVPRSQAAQYQPELVENVINAQFDQTINSLTRRIDRFWSRDVLQSLLGIDGFKIVPSGRYGALTLSAAETVLKLATAGPLITVNEARERILGWEPLPPSDKRGLQILDVSAVRSVGMNDTLIPTLFAPEQIDPDLQIDTVNNLLCQKDFTESHLRIRVGGIRDGEILKPKA